MLSITSIPKASLPLSMVPIPAPTSLSNSSQTILTSSKNISLRNQRKLRQFTPINQIEFSARKSLRTPHPAFPTQHARLAQQQVHVGQKVSEITAETNMYSVWALPPDDVTENLKKLMMQLRSEYGGPAFEPHFTVVGPINDLTETEAKDMLRAACKGVKPYTATVDYIVPGPSYYECVYCCLKPTEEVVEIAAHCSKYFGGGIRNQYMLHVSLIFGDFNDEKKQEIKERAQALYPQLIGLSFTTSKFVLYKTDTNDPTLESWEEVDSCNLIG